MSLRFRLFLTVTIALIPIAVVSVLQGMERASVDIANVRERLVQSARMAASNQENVFASGEQVLRALGNLDDVRNITGDCDRTLSDALAGLHVFTNLSRADRNGIIVCSALPQAKGRDVSRLAIFQGARKNSAFTVSGQITSQVTHGPVIGATLPLRDSAGRFQGTLGFGVNVQWLGEILKARDLPKGAVVSVFDRTGAIVASNNLAVARAVFRRMPRAETLRGGLESRGDAQGRIWTFAAAPLAGNNVFVGFAMRRSQLFDPTYLRVGTDFLLPIVMIGLAWAAIWFATERQVTQWIVYLRRIAAAYRGGRYNLRPALDDAPAEFKLLGQAMEDMAAGIEDRDKSLREAVAQKTLQIRETHHRVKNNLQVVISLLSLQATQSQDPAIRGALVQAQARIGALALVHRILNDIEDQTSVDLPQMLDDLTRQVVEAMAVERTDVEIAVDVLPGCAPGEIAVPLALFTVEALTNIFKHAFPSATARGTIKVSLQRQAPGKLRLAVEDDGVGYAAANIRSGIGSRLLKVFGRQIQGVVSTDSQPGRGTSVELVFADPNDPGRAQGVAAAS